MIAISEIIKFLQNLARSTNASAINMAFTKHITNALMQIREKKLKREASIPKKLEDGWDPIIKMKVDGFYCNVYVILVQVLLLCLEKSMICLICHHWNNVIWMFILLILLTRNL
jgi:hypothetical protein